MFLYIYSQSQLCALPSQQIFLRFFHQHVLLNSVLTHFCRGSGHTRANFHCGRLLGDRYGWFTHRERESRGQRSHFLLFDDFSWQREFVIVSVSYQDSVCEIRCVEILVCQQYCIRVSNQAKNVHQRVKFLQNYLKFV